jgi:ornithine cyclodeaminase/alanine dehydrogenase-like protein (mu-crystallin family)
MNVSTPADHHSQARAGQLLILNQADLDGLECTHEEILSVVEEAFLALGRKLSSNPVKTIVQPNDHRSIAYSMTGRDGKTETLGFKLAYEFDPERRSQRYQNHSLMFLCDDATGQPLAVMDVIGIDATRTAATTALLARVAAPSHARTALLVGTGLIGRQVLPFLATALPRLERWLVYGRHEQGLQQVCREMERHGQGRRVEVAADLEAAARVADIVIGATGAGAKHAVEHAWLRPGATTVLLGYGVHADVLHGADYRIATDQAQMSITGTDLALPDGSLPPIDAELPEILLGERLGRQDDAQRVFAYNSGMVVTDIALGRLLVDRARRHGRGREVSLWPANAPT